jgi:hypothetical protein
MRFCDLPGASRPEQVEQEGCLFGRLHHVLWVSDWLVSVSVSLDSRCRFVR